MRDICSAVPTRQTWSARARRTDLGLARDRQLSMRKSGRPDLRAPLPTLPFTIVPTSAAPDSGEIAVRSEQLHTSEAGGDAW